MENNRLKALLLKYLSAQLTTEERDEFAVLINSVDQQELYDIYNELEIPDPFFEDSSIDYDEDNVLLAIQHKIAKPRRIRRLITLSSISIAAALLLFFLFKSFYNTPLSQNEPNIVAVIQDSIQLLDSSSVSLQLANGHVINLEEEQSNKTISTHGYRINLLADGGIQYAFDNNMLKGDQAIYGTNVFSTNKGAMSNIVLEDGTHVWLNSSTTLKFPSSFINQKIRQVEVIGEAYFEVAHNDKKPFVVKSNNSKVTVLGTKFNIKAYGDSPAIQTTLVQGSVRINSQNTSKLLSPGQQAVTRDAGKIDVSTVQVDDYLAWKRGVIGFNNLTLEDILIELSRWYDIRGVEDKSSNKEFYTGTLNKSKDLNAVLNQLEKISNTALIIKERRVMIQDK